MNTRRRHPANGFSLVEVVVSAAITGLVILGVANLWGHSNQMFQQLRQRNSQEALIEDDIAAMEDLAYRYTCCPGSCTTNPSTVNASPTCKGKGPNGTDTPDIGTEYYYFPFYVPTASATPNIDAFRDLCKNGTLVTALSNQMAAAPKSKAFTDRGLTRSVVVDNGSLHRVRIDYTGTNLQRSTMVVPTAARWCFESPPS